MDSCPSENVIPVLKFITPLYHPFVNPRTNCLDIQYMYPQWRTDDNPLAMLLLKVNSMFYLSTFDVNLCPNTEGAKFFSSVISETAKREIARRIKQCVDNSVKARFDPIPGSSLIFSKPHETDFDSYHSVVSTMQLEFIVCLKVCDFVMY